MADARAPLPTALPDKKTRTRRDPTYWERRCKALELAARTLLLHAPLRREEREALFPNAVELTDVEQQIIQAYRACDLDDRQAIRTMLSRFSHVDVCRRDKREALAARRRKAITRAEGGS